MKLGPPDSRWIWPGVIVCSAVISGLFFFLGIVSPLRLIATLWFLLVCPGMAFVNLFQFDESYYEWTLAIALSISLDAIITCFLLYTGFWSIELGLFIVIMTTFLGVFLQIVVIQSQPMPSQAGQYLNPKWNMVQSLRCPKCQAEKKQWKAGLSRSGKQRYQCSQCKKIYTPDLPISRTETSRHAIFQILKVDLRHRVNLVKHYTTKLPRTLVKISDK